MILLEARIWIAIIIHRCSLFLAINHSKYTPLQICQDQVYLLKLPKPVNGWILSCWSKEELLTSSFPWHWRGCIARGSNSSSYGSIRCLLNICHVVALISVEQSLSLFTTLKILAVYAFTIFRAENVGLKALTVLFEAPRFFAMTSLVVLSQY